MNGKYRRKLATSMETCMEKGLEAIDSRSSHSTEAFRYGWSRDSVGTAMEANTGTRQGRHGVNQDYTGISL